MLDLTSEFFKNPIQPLEKNDSALYHLDIFGTNPFGQSDGPSTTSDTTSEEQIENEGQHQDDFQNPDDIWSIGLLGENSGTEFKAQLRSWERYHDPSFQEPVSAYFSESGAKGFDAALAQQASVGDTSNSRHLARNDVFFRSLLQLGLGWNSVFFRYDQQKQSFEKDPLDVRISGVSPYALDKAVEGIHCCGIDMLRMRSFLHSTTTKPNEFPALSAFSSAAAVIVYALEKLISRQFMEIGRDMSLLRLKALFHRCGELVGALVVMVGAARRAASDAQVIANILDRISYFNLRYHWMEGIFNEVAARVMKPFFGLVETWIGLRSEDPSFTELLVDGIGFAKLDRVESSRKTDPSPTSFEYKYYPEQIPHFIPPEQGESIYEIGRSLRLLKRFRPQHPLANESVLSNILPPRLHCAISWSDIERIQSKACDYESRIRAEILKYNNHGASGEWTSSKHNSPSPKQEPGDDVLGATYEVFDVDDKLHSSSLAVNHSQAEDCKLEQAIINTFEDSDGSYEFGPELASSLHLSLAPTISTQALLIDYSCLHLLFKEHDLRYHLSLQWRFQLLGDGFFTSKLSHTLFDPEMRSGERRQGTVRSDVNAGLRLGSRDSWPPASSELRLVLNSLLNKCYSSKVDGRGEGAEGYNGELPGGLSFAIRDLNDEELLKCKDENAIEALDFLRLQYKPSAVLETIITPHSLDQYDVLFRHLIRLLRMVSVVGILVRDSTSRNSMTGDARNLTQRFRLEAQHFILALGDYSFNIGVGSTWKRFQDRLARIEHCLDKDDIDGTIDAAHSLPGLRQYHEAVLDQILFSLFLSRRHAQVARLLESIFSTILSFAVLSKLDGLNGIRYEHEEKLARLYASFRKRVGTLVLYLRQRDGGSASSKKPAGAAFASLSSPTEPKSVFDHLLVRLDMKPYY